MVKIKICGITNINEIGYLNKLLPDYAGFVFAKSRRQVTPLQAEDLGRSLDPAIQRVGVFVDAYAGQVADTARFAGLKAVQLHGNEDGQYVVQLRKILRPGIEIWKALHVDAAHRPDIDWLKNADVDRFLLDTYVNGAQGGTGRCFDWKLVSEWESTAPVILAGGLNPENVKQAIALSAPYAVDTSSGVESGGVKDEQKLKAFVEAVRGGYGNE